MGIDCDPYPLETSLRQRKWIYQRDAHTCQMPLIFIPGTNIVIKTCSSPGEEVHHIVPKRALRFNGGGDPHTANNLILLCRHHHHRIHPDIVAALIQRREGNQYAIEELFKRRDLLLKKGKTYWVTTWDMLLIATATRRTEVFMHDNPMHKFPDTYLSQVGNTGRV